MPSPDGPASSGRTRMRRARPSTSAFAAAFLTAPKVQPPPTQPITVPSARSTALAPLRAAVAPSLRTTVATAKGCSSPFMRAMQSMTSSISLLICRSLEVRKCGLERREAVEIMCRGEEIDIGQCRGHAARRRRIALPAQQRIEPDDAPRPALQLAHLSGQIRRLSRVVAVAHDDDHRARIEHACRMMAIEGGDALADARAARPTGRDQRHAVERAGEIALAQCRAHMDEPGVEDEGLGLAELVEHAAHEAQEEAAVEAHRAADIDKQHEAQWLFAPGAEGEAHRHAAIGHAAMDGGTEVETPAAPLLPLAPTQAVLHAQRQALGQAVDARHLLGIVDAAKIGRA